MIKWLKPRTIVLGFILAAGVVFVSVADEAEAPEASQSGEDFSLEKAGDNFIEDAGKVGDKAEEVGEGIAEGAEDAYESTKKVIQDATE